MSLETMSAEDIRFAALGVAAIAHNGQLYDEQPFVLHLFDVGGVVEEFGMDSPDMVAAALLHDSVEDTDVTMEDLRDLFPASVTDIVWCVTDATNEQVREALGHAPDDESVKVNRALRKQHTYEKTRSNVAAVGLKLCDRIANVRASVRLIGTDKPGFIEMYQKEYPDFREALYRKGEYTDLWQVLDDLMEQPEHCVMCENQGGPLSVESRGVTTEHEACPTCARTAA